MSCRTIELIKKITFKVLIEDPAGDETYTTSNAQQMHKIQRKSIEGWNMDNRQFECKA